jgi:hypothetical protein
MAAARTLRQDKLTRISYIVGIYKALHSLLPDDLADRWVTQPINSDQADLFSVACIDS